MKPSETGFIIFKPSAQHVTQKRKDTGLADGLKDFKVYSYLWSLEFHYKGRKLITSFFQFGYTFKIKRDTTGLITLSCDDKVFYSAIPENEKLQFNLPEWCESRTQTSS